MFPKNEGTIDRALRVILGIALLAGFVLDTDATYRWAYLIGVVPLLTGLIGSCLIYTMLGIRTCPLKK